MANEEPENGQNDSGNDIFEPGMATDAGFGPELEAAEQEAKRVVVSLQHRATVSDLDKAEIYMEPNLVKRARLLIKSGPMAIKFVHFKRGNPNDSFDIGPRVKPESLMNRHAVYDALFDNGSGMVPYPHYDTFKGRLVDHQGQAFSPRTLRTRELVQALDAVGMENPSDKDIIDSLRSWALEHRRDSLIEHFTRSMPTWDGEPRMETQLIKMFQPFDTPLTRLVGKYFWLSLYNRILRPGALAPITIALIGGQDAGKSWFSTLICRVLMGDPDVGSVQLDLGAKNFNPFLRNITGKSIVANIGEMTGLNKGALEHIKAFVSKTEDDLDFKFEDSIIKSRQWITIMDGNGYAGLQRDDTGNRRFYPIFVSQLPDENGQPAWAKGFKIDFTNFKDDLWQIMAECQVWMQEHGYEGYCKLVGQANTGVQEFSMGEMERARGVIKDDTIEINFKSVMLACEYRRIERTNAVKKGFFVASSEINRIFLEKTRTTPYSKTLAPHMKALGFEPKLIGIRGYFISDESLGGSTEKELFRLIWRHGSEDLGYTDDEVDAEVASLQRAGGGGF